MESDASPTPVALLLESVALMILDDISDAEVNVNSVLIACGNCDALCGIQCIERDGWIEPAP